MSKQAFYNGILYQIEYQPELGIQGGFEEFAILQLVDFIKE